MTAQTNIRQLREQINLTQEQMAEKIGMSKNGYAKIERGETQLKIEKLEQIANIFNVDIIDLLKEDRDFSLLIGDNNGNYANKYYGNQQEIEKLQLIIDHQKELLAQKDKEIELLRKLLETCDGKFD